MARNMHKVVPNSILGRITNFHNQILQNETSKITHETISVNFQMINIYDFA